MRIVSLPGSRPSDRPSGSSHARRFLRKRNAVGLLLAFILLLALAPSIASYAPLCNWLLARSLQEKPLRMRVARVHLSWWGEIRVEGLVLRDRQGGVLAELPVVRADQSLLDLLRRPGQWGTWELTGPVVHVRSHGNENNWTSFLQTWPASEPGGPFEVNVRIQQARLLFTDTAHNRRIELGPWNGQVAHGASQTLPAIDLTLGTNSTQDLACSVQVTERDSRAVAQVHSAGIPAEWLQLLPVALPADTQVDGLLDVRAAAEWDVSRPAQTFAGTIELRAPRHLTFDADALGTKPLELAPLLATGRIAASDDGWQLADAAIEIAGSRIEGNADLGSLDGASAAWHQWIALVHRASLSGKVDLASIQSRTPGFAWQPGLELQGGSVELAIQIQPPSAGEASPMPADAASNAPSRSSSDASGVASAVSAQPSRAQQHHDSATSAHARRIVADLRLHDLRWSMHGTAHSMDDSIAMHLNTSIGSRAWRIEQAELTGPFGQLRASGDAGGGSCRGAVDFQQMHELLGQFWKLPWNDLAGRLAVDARWQPSAEGNIALAFDAQMHQLRIVDQQRHTWSLPEAAVNVATSLKPPEAGTQGEAWQAVQFAAAIAAGTDRIELETRAPLTLDAAGWSAGPWDMRWDVKLDNHAAAIAYLLDRPIQAIAGHTRGEGRFESVGDGWRADRLRMEVRSLVYQDAAYQIREPEVQFEGEVAFWPHTGRCQLPQFTLLSSTLSVRGTGVELHRASPGRWIQGSGHVRGDLARLQAILRQPTMPWQLSGEFMGQVELSGEADGALHSQIEVHQWAVRSRQEGVEAPSTRLTQTRTPAVAASSPSLDATAPPLWQETRLDVQIDGTWSDRQPSPTITRAVVSSPHWQLNSQGRWNRTARVADNQWAGSFRADGASSLSQWAPRLQGIVQLNGAVSADFEFPVGPQRPPGAAESTTAPATAPSSTSPIGALQLAWHQGRILGMPLASGTLQIELTDGHARIHAPLLPLAEGSARLVGGIVYAPVPTLWLDPGPVLEDVRIDSEVCRHWLQYVAPLAAEITRAEGTVSAVGVEQFQMPLGRPEQAAARGTVALRHATLGPGPLAQQLVQTINAVTALVRQQPLEGLQGAGQAPWITMPEQTIGFAIDRGWVHHRGALFQVGEVQVQTSGAVGLNQALALEALLKLPERWTDDRPVLAAANASGITIPISGTLSNPQIDARAVSALTDQLLRNAASGLLQQELQKQLDRLFFPK